MNKGRRNELRNLKWKRRAKLYNVPMDKTSICFRDQGRPCNCWVCKKETYKRAIKHKHQIFNQ